VKVAITAKGAGLGAWLDPAFEHALQIVIVDDDDRFSAFAPEAAGTGEPASAQATQRLIDEGVTLLVTGSIPAHDYNALREAGIRVLQAEGGSVLEILERARAGTLPEIVL
jgi:predicted Fe-Mo cluster-binding NifX family protein